MAPDQIYDESAINIFAQPARIIIAGYSNSGKTQFCTKLIKKYSQVFSKIFVCGVTSHPLQGEPSLKSKIVVQKNIINPFDDEFSDEEHTLILLEDNFLTASNSQVVADIFTRGRHQSVSVIFITQNIFPPGRFFRTISLNASHYVLMRNRDLSQVECLGRQIYGKTMAKHFVDVYRKVVFRKPYGYLLIDLGPLTPETLQLRSDIVDESVCEKVFHWQT